MISGAAYRLGRFGRRMRGCLRERLMIVTSRSLGGSCDIIPRRRLGIGCCQCWAEWEGFLWVCGGERWRYGLRVVFDSYILVIMMVAPYSSLLEYFGSCSQTYTGTVFLLRLCLHHQDGPARTFTEP